jgi:glycosyltransferase involved in cell wall biosynthesis
MRIGILVGNLDVAAGGSHTYSMQILNYLEKNKIAGVEFSLVCDVNQLNKLDGRFKGSVVAYKPQARFRLQRYFQYFISGTYLLASRRKINRQRIQNWKLISVLQRSSFDLVWSIEPLSFPLDTPYITTVWDLEHRRQPFFPEVSKNGEWDRRESGYINVLGKASFIVVGTQIGKEQIEKFYGVNSERIIVAPFSIAQNSYPEDVTRDPNLIFYPAQFWPHKNHMNLINGFKRATLVEPALRLVLVGSDKGNKSRIYSLVSSLGLENSVEFRGTVSNEELESLYRRASLMIYPSFFGPDNLPPLEAISFKCPVAVTDQPGSREQFLGGIPLFDATSQEEICQTILDRKNFEISHDYYLQMLSAKSPDRFFEQVNEGFKRFERIAQNFLP